MATVLGTTYFDDYANYQLAYDLLSQDVSSNSSTVRLYGILNVTGNSISWSSGTASVHTETQSIGTYYSRGSYTVIQKDFTFQHDESGSFSLWISASINTTYKSGSTGGTLTLPKINRIARTDRVLGSDIENNFSVDYTKYIDNYSYKLRISIPRVIMLEKINYDTSGATFTLSQETIDYLFDYTKNSGSTVSLGFAVETWDGNTQLSGGNEVTITGTITNANPIFSNFTFADTNPTTLALTGNSQYNINNYSNITATISTANKAIAQKGATMNKYKFSCGTNASVEVNYSGSSAVTLTINNASAGTYNVYAVDSRNNSTLVTKVATQEIVYNPIYLDKQNCSVQRNNNQVGEYAVLTLNGTIWNNSFGQVTNSIKSVVYQFKKTDSSTWVTGTTTISPTTSGNTFTFTGQIASNNQDAKWDLDDSYNIKVTVNDELSSSTVEFILTNSYPTMSLDKKGVGIMCAYDNNKGGFLQVGGKIIDGGKLIWTNPNPSSIFNAQTITLSDSLNNYDFYEILYVQSITSLRMLSTGKIVVGYGTLLSTPLSNTYFRATEVNPTGSTFAFEDGHSPTSTENNRCVPIYIIGYKSNKIN